MLSKRLGQTNFFPTASKHPLLPADVKQLAQKPCQNKMLALKSKHQAVTRELNKCFAHISPFKAPGKMVYSLQAESPEEVIAHGGFESKSKFLDIMNTKSMVNSGSICFSVLPEVTTIFLLNSLAHSKKAYLYAIPAEESFYTLGGKFLQVICPGALPLPKLWLARQVIDINSKNVIELGPLQGHIDPSVTFIPGERFKEYCENSLKKPHEHNFGEDHEPEFEIEPTEEAERLMQNHPSSCIISRL